MLQLGQGLGFGALDGRDLEHHRTVGQLALPGQEDPGKSAPAQFLEQAKTKYLVSHLGQP